MKKSFLQISIFSLVLMLCFTFGCQQPVEEVAEEVGVKALSDEDVQAIRSTSERYVEAMRAKDWSKVAGFFAADATRMPPNQPMHQGRDAIQLWLSQIDDLTEYTVTLEDIQGAGGIAYVRAKYTISLTLKGMDGPISDTGKAVEIWKKDSEGDWRVASAIWNSDLPLPE